MAKHYFVCIYLADQFWCFLAVFLLPEHLSDFLKSTYLIYQQSDALDILCGGVGGINGVIPWQTGCAKLERCLHSLTCNRVIM